MQIRNFLTTTVVWKILLSFGKMLEMQLSHIEKVQGGDELQAESISLVSNCPSWKYFKLEFENSS